MHISKFDNCLTLKRALYLIERNQSVQFEWYPVDNGLCKFELGGTNTRLKAYVPVMVDGKISVHPNQHTEEAFSIEYATDSEGRSEYRCDLSHVNGSWKPCTRKWFVNLLGKDLTKLKPEIKYTTETITHAHVELRTYAL